jgi:hypothetical protein
VEVMTSLKTTPRSRATDLELMEIACTQASKAGGGTRSGGIGVSEV